MTDPITFASTSPRFSFPLLFAGQAQKEFSVNEALCLTDALLHLTVEGEAASPPVTPVDGDCWLIHASPTGDWAGYGGHIACRQHGAWLYVPPRDGMRAYNRAADQDLFYGDGWRTAPVIALPVGGATVDTEARSTIAAILAALGAAGIVPPV